MHVSVPQCDVFGYFSIESEIVILIIPVDHYPKALQVRSARVVQPSCHAELGGRKGGKHGSSEDKLLQGSGFQQNAGEAGVRCRCCDSEGADMKGVCSSSR